MAFGDRNAPRMIFVAHHEDDSHPDDYVSRPHMTVLGFGRRNKDKYLTTPQSFSIGFVSQSIIKKSQPRLMLSLTDCISKI